MSARGWSWGPSGAFGVLVEVDRGLAEELAGGCVEDAEVQVLDEQEDGDRGGSFDSVDQFVIAAKVSKRSFNDGCYGPRPGRCVGKPPTIRGNC